MIIWTYDWDGKVQLMRSRKYCWNMIGIELITYTNWRSEVNVSCATPNGQQLVATEPTWCGITYRHVVEGMKKVKPDLILGDLKTNPTIGVFNSDDDKEQKVPTKWYASAELSSICRHDVVEEYCNVKNCLTIARSNSQTTISADDKGQGLRRKCCQYLYGTNDDEVLTSCQGKTQLKPGISGEKICDQRRHDVSSLQFARCLKQQQNSSFHMNR